MIEEDDIPRFVRHRPAVSSNHVTAQNALSAGYEADRRAHEDAVKRLENGERLDVIVQYLRDAYRRNWRNSWARGNA